VLEKAEKQTDVQKDIPTVLYRRQTHTQTNRQERKKRMTIRPTNRKIVII
jgi:hypothetical protein